MVILRQKEFNSVAQKKLLRSHYLKKGIQDLESKGKYIRPSVLAKEETDAILRKQRKSIKDSKPILSINKSILEKTNVKHLTPGKAKMAMKRNKVAKNKKEYLEQRKVVKSFEK